MLKCSAWLLCRALCWIVQPDSSVGPWAGGFIKGSTLTSSSLLDASLGPLSWALPIPPGPPRLAPIPSYWSLVGDWREVLSKTKIDQKKQNFQRNNGKVCFFKISNKNMENVAFFKIPKKNMENFDFSKFPKRIWKILFFFKIYKNKMQIFDF